MSLIPMTMRNAGLSLAGLHPGRWLARARRGRFALLFFFLLLSIVIYPYAESSGAGYYAFRVLGGAILLLTVYAITVKRWLLLLVIALAVPSLLQHLVLHPQAIGFLPGASRILALAFDLIVIYSIFRHVSRSERPTAETIFGALCIYLLVGFSFSSVYGGIASLEPHAFYLNAATNLHLVPDRFDFIYFSFGTLTELGAAGMTAISPFARAVSLLEAITGILYLAVMIARLMGAYGSVSVVIAQTDPEQPGD